VRSGSKKTGCRTRRKKQVKKNRGAREWFGGERLRERLSQMAQPPERAAWARTRECGKNFSKTSEQ
jgi:hypothetical protein